MKIKSLLSIFFAAAFLLNACQKNTDIFIPDAGQLNGPDTVWTNAVNSSIQINSLKNNLLITPYVDSFEVNATVATVTSLPGLIVSFPPHCCVNAAGQAVTGRVQVELQIIKKKGDMVRLNKATTYNDSLLTTAGHIFIRLKKDTQQLQLAPGIKFHIRYIDLPINTQMKLFAGEELNSYYNWLPIPPAAKDSIIFSTQGYDIYTSHLGWISISNIYDGNNLGFVKVVADIPAYFTNANTTAFAVFKDFRSVAAMRADVSSRKFVSNRLPVGKQITLVVISKLGDDYYLGTESATTQAQATGSANQAVRVAPVKKSFAEILSYLNSL